MPQNNHLLWVWISGSFIDQRERSNEELKSKDRIEMEMQGGSQLKGSSVLQNISKGLFSLRKGCVNLFYSQVGRDKLSLYQLNKGTLVYSRAEGQGPPGKPLSMIIIIKASQRNSFQQEVRIGFLPATVVQLPSHVRLFVTPWSATFQASLSLTISRSLPKFMFSYTKS